MLFIDFKQINFKLLQTYRTKTYVCNTRTITLNRYLFVNVDKIYKKQTEI